MANAMRSGAVTPTITVSFKEYLASQFFPHHYSDGWWRLVYDPLRDSRGKVIVHQWKLVGWSREFSEDDFKKFIRHDEDGVLQIPCAIATMNVTTVQFLMAQTPLMESMETSVDAPLRQPDSIAWMLLKIFKSVAFDMSALINRLSLAESRVSNELRQHAEFLVSVRGLVDSLIRRADHLSAGTAVKNYLDGYEILKICNDCLEQQSARFLLGSHADRTSTPMAKTVLTMGQSIIRGTAPTRSGPHVAFGDGPFAVAFLASPRGLSAVGPPSAALSVLLDFKRDFDSRMESLRADDPLLCEKALHGLLSLALGQDAPPPLAGALLKHQGKPSRFPWCEMAPGVFITPEIALAHAPLRCVPPNIAAENRPGLLQRIDKEKDPEKLKSLQMQLDGLENRTAESCAFALGSPTQAVLSATHQDANKWTGAKLSSNHWCNRRRKYFRRRYKVTPLPFPNASFSDGTVGAAGRGGMEFNYAVRHKSGAMYGKGRGVSPTSNQVTGTGGDGDKDLTVIKPSAPGYKPYTGKFINSAPCILFEDADGVWHVQQGTIDFKIVGSPDEIILTWRDGVLIVEVIDEEEVSAAAIEAAAKAVAAATEAAAADEAAAIAAVATSSGAAAAVATSSGAAAAPTRGGAGGPSPSPSPSPSSSSSSSSASSLPRGGGASSSSSSSSFSSSSFSSSSGGDAKASSPLNFADFANALSIEFGTSPKNTDATDFLATLLRGCGSSSLPRGGGASSSSSSSGGGAKAPPPPPAAPTTPPPPFTATSGQLANARSEEALIDLSGSPFALVGEDFELPLTGSAALAALAAAPPPCGAAPPPPPPKLNPAILGLQTRIAEIDRELAAHALFVNGPPPSAPSQRAAYHSAKGAAARLSKEKDTCKEALNKLM